MREATKQCHSSGSVCASWCSLCAENMEPTQHLWYPPSHCTSFCLPWLTSHPIFLTLHLYPISTKIFRGQACKALGTCSACPAQGLLCKEGVETSLLRGQAMVGAPTAHPAFLRFWKDKQKSVCLNCIYKWGYIPFKDIILSIAEYSQEKPAQSW